MASTKKKPQPAAAAEVVFEHDALAIRTVDNRDQAYGGYQWPSEVGAIVDCPDWDPSAECGNGFHGLLDGIGAWGLTERDNAIWQVVGVLRSECVAIGDDKVKFPRCVLLYRGDEVGAKKMIVPAQVAAIRERAKANTATGYSGHAAAMGYRGHAAATGYRGHAAATGYSGHAAAMGDRGHAAAMGDRGHAAATGDSGHAAATGDSGHAAATGDRGHAAATGYRGHAAAMGDRGHAAAMGDRGHAAATGYSGHAAAMGDSGHAAAMGYSGIAAALGPLGSATATASGAIMLAHWDTDVWPYELVRVGAFMVGEQGVEAGKTYRLNANGQPVQVAA